MPRFFSYTGTVLVRPEPVDNGRDDFRGPEFRSRKAGVLRKEFSRKRGGQSLLVNIFIKQTPQTSVSLESFSSTLHCLWPVDCDGDYKGQRPLL